MKQLDLETCFKVTALSVQAIIIIIIIVTVVTTIFSQLLIMW